MDPTLLRPQGQLSPAEAMKLAQRAPEILRSNPRAFSVSPLQSLFSTPETGELWTVYENLLLVCLRTGNERAAHECMDRIVLRFGATDERAMALQGLVKEAEAKNDEELNTILKEYEAVLKENDACVPVAKRRVALLRSMGKNSESITALNSLLEFNTTDSEAWAELADMYLSEGLYSQAIYALEQVLVLVPNAWNIHAKLGEVSLMAAESAAEGSPQKHHAEALKRFSRSVELCDDYLRGYYGLKLVTDKLLAASAKSNKKADEEGFPLADQKTVQKLNELATKKLTEIIRRNGAKEKQWQGYSEDEIAAARDLIDKSTTTVVR